MCIATNGVPPTISKRIQLNIDCKFSYIGYKQSKSIGTLLMMKMKVKAVFQAKRPGGKVSLTLSEELNFKANYEHWALFKKFRT